MAQPKQPSLTVLGGPLAGTRFPLTEGVFAVGSDPGSAFHLPLTGVGASHARIESGPGGVSIIDSGDSRGVHVNDTRVGAEGVPLRNGDIVWLGTPGEADVVMLQCILPPRAVVAVPPPVPTPPAPAAEPALVEVAPEEPADVSTVAFRPAPVLATTPPEPVEPQSVEIDVEPIPVEVTPEPFSVVVIEEPVVEPTVEAEPDPTPPVSEEGEFVAEEEGIDIVPPTASPDDAAALIEAELGGAAPPKAPVEYAFEEAGISAETGRYVTPPLAPPAPFEDETLTASPEEATFIVADEPPPPPAPRPEPPAPTVMVSEQWSPPEPAVAAPPPPLPVPRPTPPVAPPSPPVAPPSATPPVRSAAAVAPRRSATGPDASQPPRPAQTIPPTASTKSGSKAPILAVVGVLALALLAGGGFAVWKFVLSEPTPTPIPVAQAPTPAPTPLRPTPEATPLSVATPEAAPTAQPTTPPTATPTPTPAVGPTPQPTPTPKATPSPKPTPTPKATPTATAPTGPSPEQQRAAQVATLLGQADAALTGRQFDQALSLYDEALKLEPGNGRAQAQKAVASAQRDAARKKFVAGRTAVTAKGGGGLAGFEGAEVQKVDFQGRIEFEMTPTQGIKPGDSWTLRFFVVNEGKKAIRISDMTATVSANGQRTGGPQVPRTREIAPQQRALVGEMGGSWQEGASSWSAEVVVSAKGDTLKNTMTWR